MEHKNWTIILGLVTIALLLYLAVRLEGLPRTTAEMPRDKDKPSQVAPPEQSDGPGPPPIISIGPNDGCTGNCWQVDSQVAGSGRATEIRVDALGLLAILKAKRTAASSEEDIQGYRVVTKRASRTYKTDVQLLQGNIVWVVGEKGTPIALTACDFDTNTPRPDCDPDGLPAQIFGTIESIKADFTIDGTFDPNTDVSSAWSQVQ